MSILFGNRKKTKCQNCGLTLNEVYNFCPNCGQENKEMNVSFGMLVKDLFHNYFSIDSKIGHSVKPFLIQPGELTNKFTQGKRATYIHPVRLYLITSLFYFFVFSIGFNEEGNSYTVQSGDAETTLNQYLNDDQNEGLTKIGFWDALNKYKHVRSVSDEELANYMNLKVSDKLKVKIVHQIRRISSQPQLFKSYILKNIPIMMFVLLPLFALILKLFYWRKQKLFIFHLVHTLHLQSFAFLLFGIALIVNMALFSSFLLNLFFFLIFMAYAIISYKNTYLQTWKKTIIKTFASGTVYFIVLLFGLAAQFMVSFLMF